MENNASLNTNRSKTHLEAITNPIFTLIILVLILIIVFAIFGNLIVIRTVCVTRKLHYPAFFFVISLAMADFLIGFLVVPVSLVYHVTDKWILGEIACDVWTTFNIWFGCASLLNLCVVSWDRYMAITSPLTYTMRMRDSKVRILIGLIWTVSLFLSILYALGFKFSPKRVLCTAEGLPTYYTVIAFIFLFFLPTCFIIFVNSAVFKVARNQRRRIDNLEYSVSHSVTPAPSTSTLRTETFHRSCIAQKVTRNQSRRVEDLEYSLSTADLTPAACNSSVRSEVFNCQPTAHQKKSQKTYKMLLIIIIVYIVCWTPFFALQLILIFIPHLPVGTKYMGVILTYLNSAINPFLYGALNREFRAAVKRSLRRRRAGIGIPIESTAPTPQANVL